MRNPFEPPQTSTRDDQIPRNDDEPRIRGKDVEDAIYSLSTLLIAAATLVGGGAVTLYAPGIGVPLLIIASIVLFRMVALDAWRRAQNERPDFPTKLLLFLSSFGVVLLVLVSSAIAFVAVCFPVGLFGSAALQGVVYGLPGVLLGIALGAIAVVVVLYRACTKYFWCRW